MGHEIARAGDPGLERDVLPGRRVDRTAEAGTTCSPTTLVKDLGIGKQQLIEIARVLRLPHMKILILDEPTASLTDTETDLLLDILRTLQREGIACIYISHKIEEVMRIADCMTVLRDGKTVGGGTIRDLDQKEIVRMMVGREITEFYPQGKPRGPLAVRAGGQGRPSDRPGHRASPS